MPTTIIRPDSIGSDTGFDSTGATLLGLINDGNSSTGATQNNVTANITNISFQNGSYSGTINSVVLSIIGSVSGRASSTSITAKLMDIEGATLQSAVHGIDSSEGTAQVNGADYTTSLTPTLVDGMLATITPNSAGCIIYDVFITVDYTEAATASGGKITLSSGKITLSSGKITL